MKWVVWLTLCLPIIGSSTFNRTEWIVRFHGHFDESRRFDLLREASGRSVWSLERRPSRFSDFEIVTTEDVNRLSPHPWIRDVHPQLPSKRRPLIVPPTPITRRKSGVDIRRVPMEIGAQKLWAKGWTGRNIRVAIFDTGLSANRRHIRNVVFERDYTNEKTTSDTVGHGTFTAGVIGSTNRRCPGIAPDAELLIFKVFANGQESRTSWFLDAFNDAIQNNVDIINLSIGGPDFTDRPFMDKVDEVIERGIVFVSAIGNDGPTWGTLNNPADRPDVLGIGAIDGHGKLADFSSRGMTSWEFSDGYGRVKPDLVAFGVQVHGLSLNGGCRFLSGTSVASPVVSGAVALLFSSVSNEKRTTKRVRQSLMLGAVRIPGLSMFEQGSGRLSLFNSAVLMQEFKPQLVLSPPYLDMDDCPYSWPFCFQPIFSTSLPLVVNVTVNNGHESWINLKKVVFRSPNSNAPDLLTVQFDHHAKFTQTGYLGLFFRATGRASNFSGLVAGHLDLEYETEELTIVFATFPVRIRLIPKPQRTQRVLWDQVRNLYFPFGYFPRDDLRSKTDMLDVHADHPHMNFRHIFELFRHNGYFLEVSTQPLSCIDLNNYATLLIVDPEEEFFPDEKNAINVAVNRGLNLIVVADWYNASLIKKIQFEDPNSDRLWQPETGGSNVPALNELLGLFGFAFGDTVLEGEAQVLGSKIKISSGVNLIAAPADAQVVEVQLHDLGAEVLSNKNVNPTAAIFGIHWPTSDSGYVALLGDSTCLESGSCNQLLLDLMHANRVSIGQVEGLSRSKLSKLPSDDLPTRIVDSRFTSISRVIDEITHNRPTDRRPPSCLAHKSTGFRFDDEVGVLGSLQVAERLRRLEQKSWLLFGNQSDSPFTGFDDYEREPQWTIVEHFVYPLVYLVLIFSLSFLIWNTCVRRPRLRSRVFAPLARAACFIKNEIN